jgi:hypothetical protein
VKGVTSKRKLCHSLKLPHIQIVISLITLQTPLVKVLPRRKCSTKFWCTFPHKHIPAKHTNHNLVEKWGTSPKNSVWSDGSKNTHNNSLASVYATEAPWTPIT